ncbi:MAG: hypothetical protein COZ95_08750, partial [Nitrospirae bacterium CG_4_8_14_3_um_filter_50_41]
MERVRMSIRALVLFGLLFLFHANHVFAATPVTGNITTNTTWTTAGSPYQVTTAIKVLGNSTTNVTLTIEAGVEVQFSAGASLTVGDETNKGSLLVNGSLASEVLFTSSAPTKTKGSWGGITYNYTPGSSFTVSYGIVEYGTYGIYLKTANSNGLPSILIADSIIRQSSGKGIQLDARGGSKPSAQFFRNTIHDHNSNGIYTDAREANTAATIEISGSSIYGNGDSGIYAYTKDNTARTDLLVRDNPEIRDNVNYGIYTYSYDGTLNASIYKNEIYRSGRGIYVYNDSYANSSNVRISDNNIHNGTQGIEVWRGPYAETLTVEVSRNRVYANTGDGIKIHRNETYDSNGGLTATVIYNHVETNNGDGIFLEATNVAPTHHNNILVGSGFGSGKYALNNVSAISVDARYNWWGVTSSSDVAARIYDRQDNSLRGRVISEPFIGALQDLSSLTSVSHVTNPEEGDSLHVNSYRISGTAWIDPDIGIQRVEVSTDGGSNWAPAAGTASWQYVWAAATDGPHQIQARIVDTANQYVGFSAIRNVTVDGTLPTTSGTLSTDETWSGFVSLTGDVTVPQGKALTIQAGTVLTLPSGSDDQGSNNASLTELIVNGRLEILGTTGNPVTLTSSNPVPTAGDWGGITVTDTGFAGMTVQYAVVSYSQYGVQYSVTGATTT